MEVRLKGFKPGDNLSLINTYVKKGYDENKKYYETLCIIYKDNLTGKKHCEEIKNPAYEFYVVKPEFRERYNRQFVERDKCERHVAPRIRMEKEMALALGMKGWYDQKVREGDRKAIREIHKHKDVFMSDTNLEDSYRFWFSQTYPNEIIPISKCYFDIEVDTIDLPSGEFPEPGSCPVNAITIVFQQQMKTYTLLLRNPRNPLVAQFEEYVNAGAGIQDLKNFVLNHVSENNKKQDGSPVYFGLDKMEFNIVFYDEEAEIDLISDMFKLINTYQPDFGLAWNQAFDIPYLIARIETLGYDPRDIICHPDFKDKICRYIIDEKNKDMFDERNDRFDCSSYTVYLDQMIQFASRRKGQTKFPSYSLDTIGFLMANVRKLDYKEITADIAKLPYKDFKTFVFYNVMDVIVQYCIEAQTGDIDYVYSKCIMNNTRYCKIHRQTVYLANRGLSFMWECGYVKGNNVNLDNDKKPYPGAYVADPLLVSMYSRYLLNKNPTDIFDNLVDSDYKSLYPSIIRQFNVLAHTQIGFIILANNIHAKQNRTHYEYYTAGGQYIEDLQSHNWLEFCCRWFGLADFNELYNYTREIFTNEIRPSIPLAHNTPAMEDGYYYPFTTYQRYYFPIVSRTDSTGYRRPFIMKYEMSTDMQNKMKEWCEHVAAVPNQSF